MSLDFAAISPHPPIIIAEIGQEDSKKTSKTIGAMEILAEDFEKADIDTLIIVSPHSLIYPDRFNICGMPKMAGSFAQFGAADIKFSFENDLDIAEEIADTANANGIPALLYDNNEDEFVLDHGTMVPLYFLSKYKNADLKIVVIAYSMLDKAAHFTFGQVLQEAIKNSEKRIGILASGDMSHRLISGAPQDHPEAGKDFDRNIVQDLKENKFDEILYYDEQDIDDAGECGYRSILILLGALDKIDVQTMVLSYEGPFGVGYLVANFKLEGTE